MEGEAGTLCDSQCTVDSQYIFVEMTWYVLIPSGPCSSSSPVISPLCLEPLMVVLDLSQVPYPHMYDLWLHYISTLPPEMLKILHRGCLLL